jgi:hypothetical protein
MDIGFKTNVNNENKRIRFIFDNFGKIKAQISEFQAVERHVAKII